MSVVLNGSSQYLYIAELIGGVEPFTIVGYYKSDSLTVDQSIASLASSSDDIGFFTLAAAGNRAGDYITNNARDDGQGTNEFTESAIAYTANIWQHAAAVFTSDTARDVYLNGGNKGSAAGTESADPSDNRTGIGCLYRQSITWYFSGKLAEIAIWDVALSAAEIAQLAAGATPTTIQSGNLLAYWDLLENGLDKSGNGKHLSASGSPTYSSDHPTAGAGVSAPVDKTFSKELIAIGNNEVWREPTAGTQAELTAANGTIDTNKPLTVVEAFEKVFVANGTNLKVADFGNVKLHTTDVKPSGKVAPLHDDVLTGGTSGAEMVVDYITALDGDTYVYGKRITAAIFASADVVTGTNAGGDVSFTLDAAEVLPPHWYDWTVYGNSSTYGVMPEQANKVFRYQGRVGLVSDKNYPHQWYLPRQNNPWDWNYVALDAQSPVAGEDAEAGQAGDIVVTAIPYSNDYLIFACANSLQYVIGNPAEGGAMLDLDTKTGILGMWSYCWDNKDNLYILATTGLLRIPKGFGAPENLTEISYPDFIKDLAYDSSLHRITIGYNRKRHGIKIAKTTLVDGVNSGWWYDLKTEGLFPESYVDAGCGIFSMFHYEAVDPDYNVLLFGCNDGYLRFSDEDSKSDIKADGTNQAIDSYITFGPIKLGAENREGKVNSIVGILTGGLTGDNQTDSDDVTYKLWAGLSADEIVGKLNANTSPNVAGIIKAPGRWRGAHKKQTIRGVYTGIRIGNDTAEEIWGLERLLVGVSPGGRVK